MKIRNSKFEIRKTCRNCRSRGSVYVYVLATSLLVSVIGISVVTVAQINGRITRQYNEGAEAEVLAESAVEFATSAINSDSNWRTTYTSGSMTTGKALGHGTISFKIVDENDGTLANNTSDPVRVYGFGQVNNTIRIYSAMLAPSTAGLTSLQASVACVGTMTLSAFNIGGTGTLSSNIYLSGSGSLGSTIALESAGTCNFSGSGGGVRTSNATPRTYPGTSVFGSYTSATMGGATVAFANLPISGTPAMATIDHKLISPSSSPWSGTTNTKGIYIFDCSGASVRITNSRIVGTLVFLNAGTINLETGDIFEPALAGYPVLLVQGNLRMANDNTSLTEGSPTPAVNFNPSSTPIPYAYGAGTGSSNGSTSDSFTPSFTGLAYASGSVVFANHPVVTGQVIGAGTFSGSGSMNLTYSSTAFNNPPPGFTGGGQMTAVAGTWRWEPAP